jgi:Flp pilus assembly protein TadD
MDINDITVIDKEQLLKEAGKTPEVLPLLGTRASKLCLEGRFHEANRILSVLSEVIPDNYEVWNNLGVVQIRLNELDAAERSFKAALALNEECLDVYLNLALLYRSIGRRDEADRCQMEYLRRSRMKERGLQLKTAMLKGWMFFSGGDYEEAENEFRKIADSAADDPQVILDLHMAFLKLKKTGTAVS